MGLHPVALSLGSGLRVSGIASGASHLDAQELERLIEDGHAIAATATISADAVGPICAAWIGQEFALAAEDAGAPELPFELEARPAIDQRQLHEGNSVLRGQPPRVEPSVAEIDTRLEVLD
jgi:hypothetical protein